MNMPKNTIRWMCLANAGISLLLGSGCVTPVADYKAAMANQPLRSPIQFDASATVEATITVSPEAMVVWKRNLNNDQTIANYRSALEYTLRNDIVTSGLFARIETGSKADYAVQVKWVAEAPTGPAQAPPPAESASVSSLFEQHKPSSPTASDTCALTATETATGTQITTQPHAFPGGSWGSTLPPFMASLKAELAANLQAYLKGKQAQADKVLFAKASLTKLITGTDKNATSSNERNQAIIVAKNQQLPGLLREKKAEELSALVIAIEQATLTLNHEGEMAKDHAQQVTAAGGNAQQIDELRGLAISYQERIELLKPIAGALKEEIANRNR
jgi:hypothetical protein